MKRKFSLFMAAACLFSCLSFAGISHAETKSSFTDVDSSNKYSQAIITLTKLGVINGYKDEATGSFSFKPDGEITRAEFTKIITVALGIADTSAAGSTTFTDIDSHWAKSNILVASSRGIVNGFPEDNTFRPDEKVTYEQAVKMIVCAAGHEAGAIGLGGWPNGYIAQANTLGITKNAVAASQSGPATRAVVAQLMYNVLDVQIPEINPTTGRLMDNLETFLEKYLGVVQVKARVIGVGEKITSDFEGELFEGEIALQPTKGKETLILDYTPYTTDAASLEELMGQEIVVYYKEGKNGNMDTLFEIDSESLKNTVTTVFSEDIDVLSGSTLKYYDDKNKAKSISVNADDISALYYNGVIVEDVTSDDIENWLSPSSDEFIYGEVKLTDSGADGTVNIIDIMDYQFLVASRTPSTSDYIVTNKVKFKNNKPENYLANIELDPDNVNYKCYIKDANGKDINVTSIKANDVLLVAVSLDETVKTVLVNSKNVSGKVSSVRDSEITVNDNKYEISDYAQAYFDDEDIEIKSSLQATFYIDVFGTIVYGTLSTSSGSSAYTYAYIIRATVDEDDDSTANIKAFVASSAKVNSYRLDSKVKYNGSKIPASEAIDKLRENVDNNDNDVIVPDADAKGFVKTNASQVARLLIEGSTVTEIYTVDADDAYNDGEWGVTTESPTAVVPYAQYTNGTKTKYSKTNSFDGFYVNSSTTYITIPLDRESEGYKKSSLSYFSVGSSYAIQPYNVNNSKVADLVIIYGTSKTSSTSPTNSTHIFVAAEDADVVSGDDDEIYELPVFANSRTVSKQKAELENSDDDETYTDIGELVAGDLFRVGRNGNYYANCELAMPYSLVEEAIEDDCDFSEKEFEWFSSTNTSSAYGRIFIANIIDVAEDGDTFMVRTTRKGFTDGELDTSDEEQITVDSNTIILKLNDKKNEVISTFDEDSTEALTAYDLRSYEEFGETCNKVAIYEYSSNPTKGRDCKMILIYE